MALQFLRRMFRGKSASTSSSSSSAGSAASSRPGLKGRAAGKAGVNFGWPSADPDDRKRDYGDGSYLEDFLYNGMVLWVDSSWVSYAKFHGDREELEIGFHDGWVAYYGDCDIEFAREFAEAPSKGKFLHAHIKLGYKADGRHWVHGKKYRHD